MAEAIGNNVSVLIIGQPLTTKGYQAPPVGAYRLQAFLRQHATECDVFCPGIDNEEEFFNNTYAIIGVSGGHETMQECTHWANLFSKRNEHALLIAGGISATNDYETWLKIGFDVICLGYGEYTLLALSKAVLNSDNLKEELYKINGIVYTDNGKIVKNNADRLTNEMFRELSYINAFQESIPYEQYWKHNEEVLKDFLKIKNNDFTVNTIRLFTSSQCINKCGYCSSKFLSKAQGIPAKLFFLTPDEIIDLIVNGYQKYKCDMIFFNDDDFMFQKENRKVLCKKIIELKKQSVLPSAMKFDCQSRVVDFLNNQKQCDEELVSLLKQAGFSKVSLGVESFSERLLSVPIMNKNQYSTNEINNIIDCFERNKLGMQINIMGFIPEVTREELVESIYHALALLKRKISVQFTLEIRAAPGAPALELQRYHVENKRVASYINGVEVDIPQYFIPYDDEIKYVFSRLSEAKKIEEQKLYTLLPNKDRYTTTFSAFLNCMSILKLLNEESLYNEFSELLLNRITE